MLGNRNSGDRHFGLDWLRIAAFLLLIVYHIGMFFVPGDWLVKTHRPVEALVWPMLALQPWRMAMIFVVSGFASHALLTKSGGVVRFLRARSQRLLLPLIFGIVFVVPPQSWVGMVENHGYGHGFVHFWTNEWFGFRPLAGVMLPSTEHLWFIAYLWTYTMALGVALILSPWRWRDKARRIGQRIFESPHLLALPLAGILLVRVALLFTIPEVHGLLHDWVNDLTYAPAFLFGFALAATPSLWPAILRLRYPAALLAGAALLLLVAIQYRYPGERPHLAQALDRDASLIMAWSMILLLLGVAHQWLNRDHPLRAWLSEAVFPFYLVHQTIIVLVAWGLRDSGMSAPAMFLALFGSTISGCLIFHAAGRHAGSLRLFIGLPATSPPKRSAVRPTLEPA